MRTPQAFLKIQRFKYKPRTLALFTLVIKPGMSFSDKELASYIASEILCNWIVLNKRIDLSIYFGYTRAKIGTRRAWSLLLEVEVRGE